MKIGLFPICIIAVAASGCATVDLQSMAGTSNDAASNSVVQTNVVQRSVNKLRAAFTSRGFGEKTSQRKMQAATDVLLNGLSGEALSRTLSVSQDAYMSEDKSNVAILADIQLAQQHVDQTTRAAEVYLALVQPDHALDEELRSLQSALLASDRATRLFETALADETVDEIGQYRTSVDALRAVTNAFGERVRMSKSGKIALQDA